VQGSAGGGTSTIADAKEAAFRRVEVAHIGTCLNLNKKDFDNDDDIYRVFATIYQKCKSAHPLGSYTSAHSKTPEDFISGYLDSIVKKLSAKDSIMTEFMTMHLDDTTVEAAVTAYNANLDPTMPLIPPGNTGLPVMKRAIQQATRVWSIKWYSAHVSKASVSAPSGGGGGAPASAPASAVAASAVAVVPHGAVQYVPVTNEIAGITNPTVGTHVYIGRAHGASYVRYSAQYRPRADTEYLSAAPTELAPARMAQIQMV
jgi:hypothetical protein